VSSVEVASLTKRFGAVTAVDDVSFTAQAGRVTGFVGPNGAGKTTTPRVILGLIAPTSGTATIDGRRYHDLDAPARHVGAVLEDTAFHPGRTGRNHLRVLATAGSFPRSRVDEVLDLVDLSSAADRRVKGYSLGMRQRLAIAAALLGDPAVLILDEPANGLDPEGIHWLRRTMREQAAQGRAVLVSSHMLAELGQVVDDVVVIAQGRIRSQGPLQQVVGGKAQTAATLVRALDPERLVAALSERGMTAERGPADTLIVRGGTPEDVGRAALDARVVLTALGEQTRSLEEAFFELTAPQGPPLTSPERPT
jgi:ABC-2 type transport system ATP-binding protein